jgi:hypothetical protein
MKTRQGFVSNSSSSSFIISTNKGEKPKITIEIDIENYSTEIRNKEDLDKYFIGEYGYGDTLEEIFEDDYNLKEGYESCLLELEKGKYIYLGTVSNESGEEIESYLCNNGFPPGGNFEVIKGVSW